MTATASNLSQKYRRRWWTLAVLSLSLLLVELDSTILNVALPTLQREFDASASALQWLVASYILVFAGLLLFMGALGDRFGRKWALLAGFLVFGLASLAASYAGSMNQLIVARVVMGVGAALIMPATLAIIVDIFPREERVKAIALWSAVAVLGVPVGPVLGGWLLSQFWWGSVFLVAVPVAMMAAIASTLLVPESKNPAAFALDRIGALLSVGALTSLVYAIIEAPTRGVLDVWVIGAFLAAVAFGAAFVVRELRVDEPLLDVRLLRDRNISVGLGTIGLVFGSLVGMMFLLTQFLQLAQGYSALESGLRMMPIALGFVVGAAAMTDRLVARFGTRAAMVSGLLIVAAAFAVMSFIDGGMPYPALAAGLVLLGIGMANLMAPATAAVLDSVPGGNVGVGSALNDTAQQVGSALGIAVLGSLANAVYSPNLSGLISVPAELAAAAQDSIGGASLAAATVGGPAGHTLRESANAAFFDAFGIAMLAAAAVSLVTSAIVVHFMPERATLEEVETAAQPASRLSNATAASAPGGEA